MKPQPQNSRFIVLSQATRLIALLCFVVLAQSASVAHAGDHLFHDSDELCLAFHNVEKQPLLFGTSTPAPTLRVYSPEGTAIRPFAGVAARATFHARAPPVGKNLSA